MNIRAFAASLALIGFIGVAGCGPEENKKPKSSSDGMATFVYNPDDSRLKATEKPQPSAKNPVTEKKGQAPAR